MTAPLVEFKNITIQYRQGTRWISAVENFSLEIGPGQSVGLVGESGSGKSTVALALMGLLPARESRIQEGKIMFKGDNLLALDPESYRKLRGPALSMIFQDPFSSLNPVMTIREQLAEILPPSLPEMDRQLAASLDEVQLPEPDRILRSYPHQLSGGQRQRVMMAIALLRRPAILIADEPTTALDVLVQDEIIKLLRDLQHRHRMAMLFITHNIGLVKMVASDLSVMSEGKLVESGPTDSVLAHPQHPYTQKLLRSIPHLPYAC